MIEEYWSCLLGASKHFRIQKDYTAFKIKWWPSLAASGHFTPLEEAKSAMLHWRRQCCGLYVCEFREVWLFIFFASALEFLFNDPLKLY